MRTSNAMFVMVTVVVHDSVTRRSACDMDTQSHTNRSTSSNCVDGNDKNEDAAGMRLSDFLGVPSFHSSSSR